MKPINKYKLLLTIGVVILCLLAACSNKNLPDNSSSKEESQVLGQTNEASVNAESKIGSDPNNINNQTETKSASDSIEALEEKEYPVDKDNSTEESKDEIILFAQNFVNLFTAAIGEGEEVSFANYIENANLLKFANQVVKLESIKELKGENAVNYSIENEFNDTEFKVIDENHSYLKLSFSNQGSGMVSQILVKKESDKIYIADFYFGNKDGAGTIATGHHTDRKLDNPNLWNDETWVKEVFEKLEKYESELLKTP